MQTADIFSQQPEPASSRVPADDLPLDIPHVSQWLCLPPAATATPGIPQLQDFHVLLETRRGRLLWFVVNQRALPEPALLSAIARRMDSFSETPGFETLAGELYRCEELIITLRDDLITHETCWGLDLWSRRDIVAAVFDQRFSALSAGEIRDTILRRNSDWLRGALAGFLARLAPEVTATLGALRPSVYNYLNTTCTTLRRNRLQALNLFPVFLPQLFKPKFAGIRRVIDDGGPLIDAIADQYIAARPVIRAIRGTDVLAAQKLADQLPELLQVLRDIPVAWLPRNATEWGRFAESIAHIERLSRTSVLTTNNRLIFRDCARRGYRPTDIDSDEWWRVGQEIDELSRAIISAVCHQLNRAGVPGNHERHARLQIDRMLLELGIKRVGRIARRWGPAHRRAQAAYEAEHAVMGGILWPLLSETPLNVAGLIAQQLPNAEALNAEAEAMSNCVASYVHPCMTGQSQIWSLHNADGTRVTTLETQIISNDDGAARIRPGQHAGPRNTRPPKQALKAAQELLHSLAAKPQVLQCYLDWKNTTARTPISERRLAASVGVIIAALDEVLLPRWGLEEMTRGLVEDGPNQTVD